MEYNEGIQKEIFSQAEIFFMVCTVCPHRCYATTDKDVKCDICGNPMEPKPNLEED